MLTCKGCYMKISPRVTFSTQMIASVWFSIMLIAVMNWALSTIKDACSFTQPNSYTSSSMPPSSEAPSAQHACSPRARSTPASSGSSSRAPFSPSSSTRWLASSQTPPPPIPIYTAHLRRSRADPVCDAAELSLLGRGRLHLQQAHSGPVPWVVDAV